MTSEEYAIVILPGGGLPRVWPTRGRGKESFEAYCATFGATVIRAYPSLEEAIADLYLPIDYALRMEKKLSPARDL
jgi:hypothetical protein